MLTALAPLDLACAFFSAESLQTIRTASWAAVSAIADPARPDEAFPARANVLSCHALQPDRADEHGHRRSDHAGPLYGRARRDCGRRRGVGRPYSGLQRRAHRFAGAACVD